eukprot:TRINITY_DN315_c0_g1_i1.p1 TRINITY_DN315_c0_g1~~TRINITY_DN315_c0_g1_i1.p1  ORF type:complete len:257 (-),score=123.10 TRINITY_DN315_c0_g1_i1:110-880(-)
MASTQTEVVKTNDKKSAVIPPVPESILKKRLAKSKRAKSIVKAAERKSKKKVSKRRVIFQRAEKYIKEYKTQQANLIRLKRSAKRAGIFYREPEAKLAFVIRIRGINAIDPRTKKILQLLRLRQINNGVFVRLNGATISMLRLVEPYITYGYPTLKSVKELIYKRGFVKVNGQRRPISNNSVIEQKLSKFNILCIEDLIHEIYTTGKHFKFASNFLWPFKLNSPRGGLKKKSRHYLEGGDAGNRETKINTLIKKML